MYYSPKTSADGLVFHYDTGNTVRSYLGEPTTNNYGSNFRDFTGTGYSIDGEWVSDPTRFTKTYYPNLTTPIGPGATLIEESGTVGFHHLSRYGGSGESGAHSLSCYLYPLATGITDFCIGMLGDSGNNIQFNLDTRVITYGGGISNTNAFIRDVLGWPGWIRVGANFEGRGGGWVGCLGYSSYTAYTGTAGAKKCYITGLQYEYKTYPTQFTTGTRSATQGLKDLTAKSTIDISTVSFDSNAQMTFDGTNDFGQTGAFVPGITSKSYEAVTRLYDVNQQASGVIGMMGEGGEPFDTIVYNETGAGWGFGSTGFQRTAWSNVLETTTNFVHLVATYVDYSYKLYRNGQLILTTTSYPILNYNFNSVIIFGKRHAATTGPYNGEIPIAKVYNRALTADEVQRNFNAVKSRFNIA
jgi:hypothetical protein